MLKKRILVLLSCFVISLASACTPADQQPGTDTDQSLFRDGNQDARGPYDYVNQGTPRGNQTAAQNPIGYVRYQANNNRQQGGQGPNIYVDRNNLARRIAYLITRQGIKDASVLVTDDHVFVGINGDDPKKLDSATLRRIRQTALSVTPRYYRVRVVQDPASLRRINEVGTGGARGDLNRLLRDLGDTTSPGTRTPIQGRQEFDEMTGR